MARLVGSVCPPVVSAAGTDCDDDVERGLETVFRRVLPSPAIPSAPLPGVDAIMGSAKSERCRREGCWLETRIDQCTDIVVHSIRTTAKDKLLAKQTMSHANLIAGGFINAFGETKILSMTFVIINNACEE